MELKVSRTQENYAILERFHWPTLFSFQRGQLCIEPFINQTAYMYFCNFTALNKKLVDYGHVHAQSPSIIISKVADATSYNAVADPGEWPGPLPLICRPKWAQRAGKIFWETGPPLISGYGWPGPPLIWRPGSATAMHYRWPQKLEQTLTYHFAITSCQCHATLVNHSRGV